MTDTTLAELRRLPPCPYGLNGCVGCKYCENAKDRHERLLAVVDAVLDLHRKYGIYDECQHAHTDGQRDNGETLEINDIGEVCETSRLYTACVHCCADTDGDHTEECANEHKHGPDEPRCPTYEAITDALNGDIDHG